MKVYLSGSIPKGDIEAKQFVNWREQYAAVLKEVFGADCITPKAGEVDETNWMLVMGKDSRSIKISDLVVVNAEERMGAGTAMELVIAKYFKKPVVTILPKNTYHRRSNVVFEGVLVEDWVHPFIGAFSDFVIETIDELKTVKEPLVTARIKDITIIDDAVNMRELTLKE